MLAMDRFMASAISLVRMPPEALTSMPAMINAVSSRTKPAIATAEPVKAFSRAMTTGMSAPPMGSTMVTPKTRATAVSPYSAAREPGASTSQTVPTTKEAGSSTLSNRAPGNTTGAPETTPCSLPAAIRDPEKVTAPMTMSRAPGSETRAPRAAGSLACSRSLTAISAAAPPPTALKRLTSWGIAVIWTSRAARSPSAAPRVPPLISTSQPVLLTRSWWTTSRTVAPIAIAMAPAERALPRRAVRGWFIRCRPSTKQAAAPRKT
jgi:hypothetical protein